MELEGNRNSCDGVHMDIRPIPRNVWQVMPKWHIRMGSIVYIVYVSLITILSATSVGFVQSKHARKNCGVDVNAFLITFGAIGLIVTVLLIILAMLFNRKWLPQYLKTARPLGQGQVAYVLTCGMMLVMLVAASAYGLYAARFDDVPETRRCGAPARATQAISGFFLLMTFVVGVAYFTHNRIMLQRMREAVQVSLRPAGRQPYTTPPIPGQHDDERVVY